MTNEHQHEERIRAAVTEALERIEAPDRGRLARIEVQLLAAGRRRRRPNPWWWTIVGLGIAAGAAAAYWGLYMQPEEGAAVEGQGTPARQHEQDAGGASHDRDGADDAAGSREEPPDGDSPIIYIGQ